MWAWFEFFFNSLIRSINSDNWLSLQSYFSRFLTLKEKEIIYIDRYFRLLAPYVLLGKTKC